MDINKIIQLDIFKYIRLNYLIENMFHITISF